MATQEIVITPHPLPDGFCFTTYQDLLDTFSAHQTADLPVSGTQIFVSEVATPTDLGKVWLKLDALGNPINFFWFTGGVWKEVDPPNTFWGIGGNTSNDYTVSVSHPPEALVTGQIFFFKITATNTGAATLKINAFATAPFVAAGAPMPVGSLRINSIVGAVWTGSAFELLGGVSTITVAQIVPGAERQFIQVIGGVPTWVTLGTTITIDPIDITFGNAVTAPVAHNLLGDPDVAEWKFMCKTPDLGYSALKWIPLSSVHTFVNGSAGDKSVYTPIIDGTSFTVSMQKTVESAGVLIPNGTTGIYSLLTNASSWKIVGRLYRF